MIAKISEQGAGPKRRLQLTDDCNVLLWFARKYPWIKVEHIERFFYPRISRNGRFIMKRVNLLVAKGLLNKWKTPHLHYTLSKSGLSHLDYWQSKIKAHPSEFMRAIQSRSYGIEYIEPTDLEPRFQDYTHSNFVIESCLQLAKSGRFDIVEALDYVRNKRHSLFIRNFPDILLMQFKEDRILRILVEIENAPITFEKMVTKLVRCYKDTEGVSDLVEHLQSQEGKPVGTFHFFFFTSPQFMQYYVKTIRQILGTNFDSSVSDAAWKSKWENTYKMEKWIQNFKGVSAAGFQRWLQKGRLFFAMLPPDYAFQGVDLVTYDNLKVFPKNPVHSGMGTDGGIASFPMSSLWK